MMKVKIVQLKDNPKAEEEINDFLVLHAEHLGENGIITQVDRVMIYYTELTKDEELAEVMKSILKQAMAKQISNRLFRETAHRKLVRDSLLKRGSDNTQLETENQKVAVEKDIETDNANIHYTMEILEEVIAGKFKIE